jgi:RHS repeat-associated protein
VVIQTATGAVSLVQSHDSFGRRTQKLGTWDYAIGYAGGQEDPFTGLIRAGARDFDPALGRWLSRDRLRFGSGQSNLFSYVGADPVNFIDVSGYAPAVPLPQGGGMGGSMGGLSGLGDKMAMGMFAWLAQEIAKMLEHYRSSSKSPDECEQHYNECKTKAATEESSKTEAAKDTHMPACANSREDIDVSLNKHQPYKDDINTIKEKAGKDLLECDRCNRLCLSFGAWMCP